MKIKNERDVIDSFRLEDYKLTKALLSMLDECKEMRHYMRLGHKELPYYRIKKDHWIDINKRVLHQSLDKRNLNDLTFDDLKVIS